MTDFYRKLTRIALGFAALGSIIVGLWPTTEVVFDPEKALAAATAIVVWLGVEWFLPDNTIDRIELSEHDKSLADQILKIVNERYLGFLRDHDFGASWRDEQSRPTYELLSKLEEVRSEFVDKELQKSLMDVRVSLQEFAERLALDADYVGTSSTLLTTVPPVERATDMHEPDTVLRVQKLNDLATALLQEMQVLLQKLSSKGINLNSDHR